MKKILYEPKKKIFFAIWEYFSITKKNKKTFYNVSVKVIIELTYGRFSYNIPITINIRVHVYIFSQQIYSYIFTKMSY